MTPDQLAVLTAILAGMEERCYDPDVMEYGPSYPCARCRLRAFIAEASAEVAA